MDYRSSRMISEKISAIQGIRNCLTQLNKEVTEQGLFLAANLIGAALQAALDELAEEDITNFATKRGRPPKSVKPRQPS